VNEPQEFLIDMTLPAEERWQDVIAACRRGALKLARWTLSALDRVPLSHLIRGAIAASHRRSECLYDDDLSAWAAGLGMPHRDLMAVNAAYELAQFGDVKLASAAVIAASPVLGMVHGRTLAWDMKGAGESTIVYHFVGCPLEYMSVALPGMVGVISGMGPGRFSIALAHATPQGRPTLDWGPQILARHVLETARTYDEAVSKLCETPLRSPGIFTVAGADGQRACVVERTHKTSAVRELADGLLLASNHYISPALAQYNTTPALLDLSKAQVRAAKKAIDGLRLDRLGDLFTVLDSASLTTENTCQQVAFAPAEGLYWAVARST
jgi:hypothetical protein